MVVVGADVHKRTHTFVAVDEVGRQLGTFTVAAVTEGHQAAARWARDRFGEDLLWALEDCRHLSARLERDLLGAGQRVVRVPPKMMAEQRRTARTRGKSDPIDALAVARAAQRDPGLPVASHDEVSSELKLLVDRREDLVGHRTAAINRLHDHVHRIDPGLRVKDVNRAAGQRRLAEQLSGVPGVLAQIALDELDDITALSVKIDRLHKDIAARVAQVAPALLGMPGAGALTAAKLIAETAGVARFKSEAAFARHAGVAPIPVWSGNTAGRVRLCRAGNRQLNAALHRIAITQIRLDGPGRVYFLRKKAEGMSTPEALRCLKRQIARVVFSHLHADEQARTTASFQAAA